MSFAFGIGLENGSSNNYENKYYIVNITSNSSTKTSSYNSNTDFLDQVILSSPSSPAPVSSDVWLQKVRQSATMVKSLHSPLTISTPTLLITSLSDLLGIYHRLVYNTLTNYLTSTLLEVQFITEVIHASYKVTYSFEPIRFKGNTVMHISKLSI